MVKVELIHVSQCQFTGTFCLVSVSNFFVRVLTNWRDGKCKINHSYMSTRQGCCDLMSPVNSPTYLQLSMTNTTSLMVMLVSAMLVDRIT